MTVRVWMKPNDLGETGYCIDFPEADGYHMSKARAIILTSGEEKVGQVQVDRWDAAVVLEEHHD